ncbi:hypothetical protein [Paraburkholderia sp. BL10I2N1]|uniref:lysozyme inhibitor LprI family protein n=1 Tax=Paraburkholderia sp. BL10I2N1 TaxID=1938796 RepID=UPI001060BDC4|nr:hypothetical protein [Paraburkholderia sp. BL10I2N1]TDN61774.1 uncharacterized protein B0G77_5269 [Paraburkholderia sp. BL10I2N1]
MKISRYILLAGLLLADTSAHATSFDCNKGHSVAERLICHNADLSKLDDQLGKLYWKVRRATSNRRSFINDSDSKWAWREANCTDEVCLTVWYSGRIEELQRLLADTQPGETPPPQPQGPNAGATRALAAGAPLREKNLVRQCTATDLGMTWHDQCATVLKQNTGWRRQAPDDGWFCSMAMLEPSHAAPDASQ